MLLLSLLLLSLTLTQVPYYPYAKKRPAEVRDKREQLVLCANTTCIICSAVFFPRFQFTLAFLLFYFFPLRTCTIQHVEKYTQYSFMFLYPYCFYRFPVFSGRRLQVSQPSSRLSVVVRLKKQRMLSLDNLEDGLDFCAIPTEVCRFFFASHNTVLVSSR